MMTKYKIMNKNLIISITLGVVAFLFFKIQKWSLNDKFGVSKNANIIKDGLKTRTWITICILVFASVFFFFKSLI